jgi:hypothetical protein
LLLDTKAAAKDEGLADVPTIASSLGNDMKTDMSISEVASQLPLAKTLSDGSVQQVIMTRSPYFSNETIEGESALAPNWTAIQGPVAQYFPT